MVLVASGTAHQLVVDDPAEGERQRQQRHHGSCRDHEGVVFATVAGNTQRVDTVRELRLGTLRRFGRIGCRHTGSPT